VQDSSAKFSISLRPWNTERTGKVFQYSSPPLYEKLKYLIFIVELKRDTMTILLMTLHIMAILNTSQITYNAITYA